MIALKICLICHKRYEERIASRRMAVKHETRRPSPFFDRHHNKSDERRRSIITPVMRQAFIRRTPTQEKITLTKPKAKMIEYTMISVLRYCISVTGHEAELQLLRISPIRLTNKLISTMKLRNRHSIMTNNIM